MTKLQTNTVERVAYRCIGQCGENWAIVELDKEDTYPDGLPVELVKALLKYGCCAYCGAAIAPDLRRCSCNQPQVTHYNQPVHIEIYVPYEIHEISTLWLHEQRRLKARRRRERIKQNGGTYTREDTQDLYRIQEGACYYCGNDMPINHDGNEPHVDHVLPVSRGGSNDITNIVLACPRCNIRKSDMDGPEFSRLISKERSPETARKVRRIRQRLSRYLKQRMSD